MTKRSRMRTHEFAMTCPFCGCQHECASNVPGSTKRPEDGDRSLCIKCGEYSIFSCLVVGGLRKPTPEEMLEQASNVETVMARLAWSHVTRERAARAEQEARQRRIDEFVARRRQ